MGLKPAKELKILVVLMDNIGLGGIQGSAFKILGGCQGRKSLLLLNGPAGCAVPSLENVIVLDERGLSGDGRKEQGQLSRIMGIRQEVSKASYDIVFSMGFSVNALVLFALRWFARRPKIILGVRNSLRELSLTRSRMSVLRNITPWVYRFADHVVVVSEGAAEELRRAGVPPALISVVHNGYDLDRIRQLASEPVEHPFFSGTRVPVIVAVGRLSFQKNVPLLLDAFARVRNRRECRLLLVGDGPESGRLKELAAELGIEADVSFAGHQYNPYRYIARSDVMALSSNWEGFANVLCEGMACGIPVVSTDCPVGTNEIVRHGHNGFLVTPGNPDEMAAAIEVLLSDEKKRLEMGRNAASSVEIFSLGKMIAGYDSCFAKVASEA